jgi:hypothetical protein
MSKPPLTASSGTFGSGPGPKTPPPAGVGQRRQKSAFPKRAAHLPNGPNDPAGSASTADLYTADRLPTGVFGSQGKGPSRHTVAAYRPVLRLSAGPAFVTSWNRASRNSGWVFRAAPRTVAGSSATRRD